MMGCVWKMICLILVPLALASCSATTVGQSSELIDFSQANCFYWYFKSNGYDTSEISKVTSGIASLGSFSPGKYQQVAELVKGYTPQMKSKQDVDPDLAKCFILKNDTDFLDQLKTISE